MWQRLICPRYQRHRWQIFPPFSLALLIPVVKLPPGQTMGTIADNLKRTWKKNIYMLTLLPKVSKRNHKKFSDWRFFPVATGVNDTGGKPWAVNISANFRKNLKRPSWYNQGLGGNWFMKKPEEKKISWYCPFKPLNLNTEYVLQYYCSTRGIHEYMIDQTLALLHHSLQEFALLTLIGVPISTSEQRLLFSLG